MDCVPLLLDRCPRSFQVVSQRVLVRTQSHFSWFKKNSITSTLNTIHGEDFVVRRHFPDIHVTAKYSRIILLLPARRCHLQGGLCRFVSSPEQTLSPAQLSLPSFYSGSAFARMRSTASPQHEGLGNVMPAHLANITRCTSVSMTRSGLRCLVGSRSSFCRRLARHDTARTKTVPCIELSSSSALCAEPHEAQENPPREQCAHLSNNRQKKKHSVRIARRPQHEQFLAHDVHFTDPPAPSQRATDEASIHFILCTNANTRNSECQWKKQSCGRTNWCVARCARHDQDHEVHICAFR